MFKREKKRHHTTGLGRRWVRKGRIRQRVSTEHKGKKKGTPDQQKQLARGEAELAKGELMAIREQ